MFEQVRSTATVPLKKLKAAYPWLPKSYLSFLSTTNGADAALDIEPGWAVVWSAEDALTLSNQYGLPEYLPGYFAFGSNGGGELLVFPIDGIAGDRPVFMVPAVGMAISELQQVAESFAQFAAHIGMNVD